MTYFTDFFIKRPVFATILNLLIIIIGCLAFNKLQIREYPEVVIPTFTIQTNYSNSSAMVVESEITIPLENHFATMTGVEQISSTSNAGNSRIEVIFKPTVAANIALTRVRDKISQAKHRLPKEAAASWIQQKGGDDRHIMYLGLYSSNSTDAALLHYAKLHITDQLKRVPGVAVADAWGSEYQMQVILDRLKMYNYGINVDAVIIAMRNQNLTIPAGKINNSLSVNIALNLTTPDDFAKIIIKHNNNALVRLGDIAQITLAANHSFISKINGKPGIILGITPTGDSNPLIISHTINKLLKILQLKLPDDMRLEILMDTTRFIKQSLSSIYYTIFEAIILVAIVVLIFLGSFRAALIPIVAIPVALFGVFAIMSWFGISINTLSLLAMVLAIGMVVDDAIVVLENIYRYLEEGKTALEAALQGGREIVFAIIAMTGTLASVFIPIAFMHGAIGQLFQEFAITLAGAVIISGVTAITLSPVMCSKVLRRHNQSMFPKIEQFLNNITNKYKILLTRALQYPKIIMLFTLAILIVSVVCYKILPQELAPKEDRGALDVYIAPINQGSIRDLEPDIAAIEGLANKIPEKTHMITFSGDWGSQTVITLIPWNDRQRSTHDIVATLRDAVKKIPGIYAYPNTPDSGLPGVRYNSSQSNNLALKLQTTGSYQYLQQQIETLIAQLEDITNVYYARTNLELNNPSFNVKLDQNKMALLGITPQQIAEALQLLFSDITTLKFNKDNILYDIKLTTATKIRDVTEIYLTTKDNKKISLGSLVQLQPILLPKKLAHDNQLRTATVFITAVKGVSPATLQQQALDLAIKTLPNDIAVELAGNAEYQQKSQRTLLLLFAIALIFIYSILAMQFESFSDPLIILVTVPLACLGALLTLKLSNNSLNIFTQIGLIALIGIISKHGILMVEFANKHYNDCNSHFVAIIQAATLRLRPILMTTFSTIVGVIPLIITTGAGSEARQAIGYTLLGGLVFGTILTLIILPNVYILVKRYTHSYPQS